MKTIQKPKENEYPAYSRIYMDLLEDDWAGFTTFKTKPHQYKKVYLQPAGRTTPLPV